MWKAPFQGKKVNKKKNPKISKNPKFAKLFFWLDQNCVPVFFPQFFVALGDCGAFFSPYWKWKMVEKSQKENWFTTWNDSKEIGDGPENNSLSFRENGNIAKFPK